MVSLKKDAWLYAMIAGVLALISIFTPATGVSDMGMRFYQWFGEVMIFFGGEWYVGSNWGNGVGIYAVGIASFSGGSLLFYGVNTWRGKEFKWTWVVYMLTGIAMLVVPILYWVSLKEPFSGTIVFGFAPLGILLAGGIAVVASVLDKTNRR
jgi:hypothetical protein